MASVSVNVAPCWHCLKRPAPNGYLGHPFCDACFNAGIHKTLRLGYPLDEPARGTNERGSAGAVGQGDMWQAGDA